MSFRVTSIIANSVTGIDTKMQDIKIKILWYTINLFKTKFYMQYIEGR